MDSPTVAAASAASAPHDLSRISGNVRDEVPLRWSRIPPGKRASMGLGSWSRYSGLNCAGQGAIPDWKWPRCNAALPDSYKARR